MSVVMIWGILALQVVLKLQEPAITPVLAMAQEDAAPSPTRRPVDLPPTWTQSPALPPTMTPSQLPPTITFTPSPTARPALRPTSVDVTITYNPSSTLAIPTAVPAQSISDEAITIILLGSDQRPDWDDWHTDAIQYVVIHPDIPAASILSIPRDLYV